MSDQDRPERRSAWMKAEELARVTGASVATVKRRAADGKPIKCPDGTMVIIESERIERPQGWEWRVRAVTALPEIERRSEKHDQRGSPALTSGAHSDERALNILEAILLANGDTMIRQAEEIQRLTEALWQKDGDARVARSELSSAQAALSAALKRAEEVATERDVERHRANRLVTDVVDLTEERDVERQRADAAEARLRELAGRPAWKRWLGIH